MARRFDTLPALPGASDEALYVIAKMLDVLENTQSPSREVFLSWIIREFVVHEKTAINAIQGLERSGLITIRRDGAITLTMLGKQVQQTGVAESNLLLAPHFLATYNGLAEILNELEKSEQGLGLTEISEHLGNRLSHWKLGSQIHWLIALGSVDYGEFSSVFKITPFGKTVLNDLVLSGRTLFHRSKPDTSKNSEFFLQFHERQALSEQIMRELDAACVASTDYVRLEKALVQCFSFLGYSSKRIGGPGNTDVLIKAVLGPASYSVAVDAKSHLSYRRADVEPDNIAHHRQQHKAKYAMAIAKRFVQGRRLEEAKAQQVLFMTVDCLQSWIQLHSLTPLSLTDYEIIFQSSGLMNQLPSEITTKSKHLKKLFDLMAEVFAIFSEAHRVRLSMNIPIDHLLRTANERHSEVPYQMEELREVVSFLRSPFLSYLGEDKDGGLFLERNPEELPHVLATFIQGVQPSYKVETE